MKRVATFLLILLALGVASCDRQQQQQGSTVVLVVRHADKASDAEDSPLSEAGTRRAQALAAVAAGANVEAIYTTQFKRSHDTAQPLAERTGVAVTESPVDLQNPGDYGQRLARDILEKHRGQTVLVVGHGNTVASIVEGLTGRTQQLGDIQYGDLFIVTVPPSGPPGLIRAQYGAGAVGSARLEGYKGPLKVSKGERADAHQRRPITLPTHSRLCPKSQRGWNKLRSEGEI